MEERAAEILQGAPPSSLPRQAEWRDLREWLALVDADGQLKRVTAPVDPDEELSAIAFMATRREDAPALLFDNLTGDEFGRQRADQHAGREQGTIRPGRRPRPRALDRRHDRGNAHVDGAAHPARPDRQERRACK